MNLVELRKTTEAASPGPPSRHGRFCSCKECDAEFTAQKVFEDTFHPAMVLKLLAVVEAASDEALSWNQDRCDPREYEQWERAWAKLEKALAALEEDKP